MVILANVNPIFREKKVHLSILRAAWGTSLNDDERSRGYGAAGPRSTTLPLLRTRPQMRALAALLSCIRGRVLKNGVLAHKDFQVKSKSSPADRLRGSTVWTKLRAACN